MPALQRTDSCTWIATLCFEMLLRSIFDSDWEIVAEAARDMGGRTCMPVMLPLCAHSSIVLAAMKEALVRDVWRGSWTKCAHGARAVEAVLGSLERQVPDAFSDDVLCALKHCILRAACKQDEDSLHRAARLAHDLTQVFHRSLPSDYVEITSSMIAGVVQSLHHQDWEGAASKALHLREVCRLWKIPLATHNGEIASAIKTLLARLVLDGSWEGLTEAVRCIAVVVNALDPRTPESSYGVLFDAMKARLIRLAAESSWMQLDHRSGTAIQVAHVLEVKLPDDYGEVVSAIIDEAIAGFSRRDWFAAHATAGLARRVVDRWSHPPREYSDRLVTAMKQTLTDLLSTASWMDAEQGALFSLLIASTVDTQLPDEFYLTIMSAWRDSFVQVFEATDWESAKQAARFAISVSSSFRREIPRDISDGVVEEMRRLFVEWASQGDLSPVGDGIDLVTTDMASLVSPAPADFFADVLAAVEGRM